MNLIIKTRCRNYIAAWLLCSLAASPCLAQQTTLNDWRRVQNMPADSAIVVKTKTGDSFHGQVVHVTTDALLLNTDERHFPGRTAAQRTLAQSEIQEIRTYRQGPSILAGAGIGAAAGAGLGLAARSKEDGDLAAVALAVLGGLLGGLIGRHAVIVKGKKIYIAP